MCTGNYEIGVRTHIAQMRPWNGLIWQGNDNINSLERKTGRLAEVYDSTIAGEALSLAFRIVGSHTLVRPRV